MLTIKPSEVPDHLGGHMNKTHVDSGSLSYMKTVLDCSSILDVGCGPGGHVEERYMSHYMETFQLCNYLIVTHAVPGQAGHHHVNCQSEDYWIDAFDEFGFDYKSHLTQEIRNASTMVKPFIQRTGLVFKNSGRRQ
jgi:hypothetical protein